MAPTARAANIPRQEHVIVATLLGFPILALQLGIKHTRRNVATRYFDRQEQETWGMFSFTDMRLCNRGVNKGVLYLAWNLVVHDCNINDLARQLLIRRAMILEYGVPWCYHSGAIDFWTDAIAKDSPHVIERSSSTSYQSRASQLVVWLDWLVSVCKLRKQTRLSS